MLYLELLHEVTGNLSGKVFKPGIYSFETGSSKMFPVQIAYSAERIWVEDNRGVYYQKNRNVDPQTTPVDMEEFLFIKLKAVPYEV